MNTEHRCQYDDEQSIPKWLRWIFTSIDRVGFPIVAFGLMWYMCQISMSKLILSVEQNTAVLTELRSALKNIVDHD